MNFSWLLITLLSLSFVAELVGFLGFGMRNPLGRRLYAEENPNSIVGSNNDEGDIPEDLRIEKLPKLSDNLLNTLQLTLGEFVSSKAIETITAYMKEFNSNYDERWLTNYCNYKRLGFKGALDDGEVDSLWTDWLERMIYEDKLKIQFFLPPQMFGKDVYRDGGRGTMGGDTTLNELGGLNQEEEDNTYSDRKEKEIRMEYVHDIQPRKIANQILEVRENICKELQLDIPCIRLENVEAVRYAKCVLEMGEEEALKTIKMTRSSTAGGSSTPFRDRTYHEISVIITNFALEMVRQDLISNNDISGESYIEDYLEELKREEESRTVVERLLHEYTAPMKMMERLYSKGLVEGLNTKQQISSVNVLKIAQNFLDCRFAISLEISKLLEFELSTTRKFYRMIKDRGGFNKFDVSTGNVRLVDLNAERGSEYGPSKIDGAYQMNKKNKLEREKVTPPKDEDEDEFVKENDEKEERPEPSSLDDSEESDTQQDSETFGSTGPVLM